MIQYLYSLQYFLYENKYIPSELLQSMRSLCGVYFGEWANYFLIVQWIFLHRGRVFLVNKLIYYISFLLGMRPTVFLLLLYYDWFVAIVSSSTGSPCHMQGVFVPSLQLFVWVFFLHLSLMEFGLLLLSYFLCFVSQHWMISSMRCIPEHNFSITVPLFFNTGSFDIDYLESIRHVSLILFVFDKNFFP